MTANNQYISLFKIDGVPIMSPLMTPEKRKEMSCYKKLAKDIEMKLKQKSYKRTAANAECKLNQNIGNDSPLQQQQQLDEGIRNLFASTPSKEHSRDKLRKSDTFIYDVLENRIIMPYDKNEYEADQCKLINSDEKENDLGDSNLNKNVPNNEILEEKSYPSNIPSDETADLQPSTPIPETTYSRDDRVHNIPEPEDSEEESFPTNIPSDKTADIQPSTPIPERTYSRDDKIHNIPEPITQRDKSPTISPAPKNKSPTDYPNVQKRASVDSNLRYTCSCTCPCNSGYKTDEPKIDKSRNKEELNGDNKNDKESELPVISDIDLEKPNLRSPSKEDQPITAATAQQKSEESVNEVRKSISLESPKRPSYHKLGLRRRGGEESIPENSARSPSPHKENDSCSQLLRSNSFILDSPSDVLIEYMVKNKNGMKYEIKDKATGAVDSPPNKPQVKTINITKSLEKPNRRIPSYIKNQTAISTNSKPTKSPYEVRHSTKPKLLKRHKSTVFRTTSSSSIKQKNRNNISHNNEKKVLSTKSSKVNIQKHKIEVDVTEICRLQLLKLFNKQQEEQKRMQQAFEEQQHLLLESLMSNISPTSVNLCEEKNAKDIETDALKGIELQGLNLELRSNEGSDNLVRNKNIRNSILNLQQHQQIPLSKGQSVRNPCKQLFVENDSIEKMDSSTSMKKRVSLQ